ncbi:MAG: galactokinase [Planctomycetes bacterium]|nr:galactokinase [Planctomycetota bacterium]
MERLLEEAQEEFAAAFATPGGLSFIRSPGVVNLMGGHTEVHGGLALPVAVHLNLILGYRPKDTRQVRLHSVFFQETRTVELGDVRPSEKPAWSDLVRCVASELERKGVELRGMDGVIAGDLPVGAELGSSAALAIACALAFLQMSQAEMGPVELAQLCRDAETRCVGRSAGLLAALGCLLGDSGMALKVDFQELETLEYVPLHPADAQMILCDTLVRNRERADQEMRQRQEQCREGVRLLAKLIRSRPVKSVREVTLRDFKNYGQALPLAIRKRLQHVVTENERVRECADSLKKRNLVRVGILLDASHASLRDDYEVSCPELNGMAEIAWNTRGVLGTRMTGNGFGGLTVSLVDREHVPVFCETVAREYKARWGVTPGLYVCQAGRGAGPIGPERG